MTFCSTQVHAEDIFQQDTGFDGVVSIEAEHFNTNLGQGGKTWNSTTKTGQSGTNVMQAMTNTGVTVDTNITTTSPRLDYKINFKKTGTHYIWVRGSGATTADDSVHAGFNGAAVTTADKISSFTTALGWSKTTLDASAPATVNVTTVGQHTLNIWMREDGMVIDKIVVTSNANYSPSGTGPQESIGGVPPATAGVLNNPVINDNNVTLSWNAVSGATGYKVKYSTTAGGKGTKNYTVNSGCVAGWKLDETSGNFADACGTNTGTIVGTVNRAAAGKYNKAAEFLGIPGGGNSGNSAYVNVGSAAAVDNLRAKTITAWVKPQSLGYDNAGRVLSKDYQYGWVFRLASNNKIAFSQAFTGGTVTWTTVNAVVLTNAYQHVAVSYAGTGISNVPIIYFNGVPQTVTASGTPYGSYANDAAYNLTMGIEYTAYQFHGLMDEVAMFNRGLTQAEIQEVMAHGLDGRQGETYETVINAGNVTQYTVNNLPRGATYYLVVTALNQYGEGINSNEKNAFIVPADYVRNVDYNAAGQITKVEYGNGTITTYAYDPLNLRLTQLKTTDAQSLVIQNLSYTYDSVGNIRAITDAIHSDSQTFKYDALNRLTEAAGDNYATKTYAYDQIGNITSKEGINYTYGQNGAGPHAVTSLSNNTTMTYDSNGNMVSRNKAGVITTYEYDVENRLLKVKEGASTIEEYEYDGDGGRTKKTTTKLDNSIEVTKFVGSLYEETGPRITKHLFLGSKRMASITNNEIIFIHENHLGSANIITDDAGLIKELIEYEPYGKFARHEKYGSSEEVAWHYFTGQRLDERTGLYYYNARYYDPSLGRFITPDWIVPGPSNPQALNRYSYSLNDPVNRVDPSGNWSFKKLWKKAWDNFVHAVRHPFDIKGQWNGLVEEANDNGPVTSAAVAFVASGFNPIVAISAAATSAFLDTGSGRRLTNWVANELYDDILGFSPRTAYMLAYLDLSMTGNYLFERGLVNLTAERGDYSRFDINNPEHKALLRNQYGESSGYYSMGGKHSNPDTTWNPEIRDNSNLWVITKRSGDSALLGDLPYGPAVHTGARATSFPNALNMKYPGGAPLQKGITFGFCHQASNATLLRAGFSNVVTQTSGNFSGYATTFVYGNYGGGLMIKANSAREAYNNRQ